ncbi:MAG: hypothetical protein JJ975_14000 [Bacteroidia bacterium]|nr:hypothetical protein [Bacteroidia bacterium]
MKNEDHFEHLAEIRSLMERSSRFISLSGLSGILAGTYALIGAFIARKYIKNSEKYLEFIQGYHGQYDGEGFDDFLFFILLGLAVMALSLITGVLLTARRAKKNDQKMLDRSAIRLLVNLGIPLVAGGLFCASLLSHGYVGLIAPATLIFYGLALINGGKYTLDSIRHLGIAEVIIGLIAAIDLGNGLFYWAIGFGILHIVYGARMWWKYERN